MKTKQLIRVMAVALVALLVGASPTWAWGYEDWDYDDGGGTFNFRSENYYTNGYYAYNLYYFKTNKSFDYVNGQLFWEYTFRFCPEKIYPENIMAEGEILLMRADGSMVSLGSWKKARNNSVSFYRDGYVTFGSTCKPTLSDDYRYLTIQVYPDVYISRCTKVVFKSRYVYKDQWDFGWFQYEKELNKETISEESPMPKLSLEWGSEGRIVAKAQNVPDKIDAPPYRYQKYKGESMFYRDGGSSIGRGNHQFFINDNWVTITNRKNGKLDFEYDFGGPNGNADETHYYPTLPYYFTFEANVDFEANGTICAIYQPKTSSILKPYTRPLSVTAIFDKWHKQATVSWTRNEQMRVPTSKTTSEDVDCSFDGKWYVVRYDKKVGPEEYEVVCTLDGNSTELEMTDNTIEYDHDYAYRVVFLPTPFAKNFKDKLTSLPCENSTHSTTDLWEEAVLDTHLEMPIRLTQDRTFVSAVRLVWEYCVQPSGQNWTIEYRPEGVDSWRVLDASMSVDPDKSQASFDTGGSVCDLVDYRVKTTYVDRDFYSNVITGSLPAGSYISEVKASTGTEEKTVIVKWKVERADVNNDIYYRVLRRAVGTEEWTQLTNEIHGKDSEYTFIDDRPLAGTYYEYSVQAFGAKCEEQLVKTDEVIAPGFSQARGTITGHIAYGTGTAVSGVRVNLVKSLADESTDQPQFLSRYLEGEGKGLQWMADKSKYEKVLNGSKSLTIQLWAKPVVTGSNIQVYSLLSLANVLELGVINSGTGNYNLYSIDKSNGDNSIVEYPSMPFDINNFTHVAAVYDDGFWTFYVGNDTLNSVTTNVENRSWNVFSEASDGTASDVTLSFGGSIRSRGSAFNGYIDDIRLWNRAIKEKELKTNYTRILGGTENGLILYWPLDEGLSVKSYAFDVARQDGVYLLNHPVVGVNALPSAIVPDAKYLSLYGLTDSEGDYIIKGIPFQQGGTNYKLAPTLGIHEFNPNMRSMFISPTSLTANNIDFEDVSSFPMSGYIYYAGTNIPAEGIQFYVDGELVTANGEVEKTDNNGYYEISVPIGNHYVEAKLEGHKMVSGGRFPTRGTFNFDRRMQYDFSDSTLVNFVGRVGGGERNDTLAVGFGASKNNIGIATITLGLNNESFSFNYQDGHITDATTQRTWQSDTTSIASRAWTGTDYDAKYIYIRTDSLTGEFSALLPPLKYTTKSIRLDNNRDIEFTSLPEIDLTSLKKELTDSLKQPTENGDSVWNYFKYNSKMVRTHFAKPEVDLWQMKGNGAFGEQEFKDYNISSTETVDITDIWTLESDSIKYNYGHPIFARQKKYVFGIHGYEVYTNYDTGKAVADTIPMKGQVLTVANEMSDEQDVVSRVIDPSLTELKAGAIYNLKRNQVRLDENGTNEITFTTGVPNVTAPYTRQFSMSYERNKRTYVGPLINGVVLGELTNGNNFVTDGPEHVDMVLRDPPGSKGKATWKTGTSYTTIDSRTNSVYWDESITWDLIWGCKLETAIGMGVAIISGKDASTTMVAGEKGSFSWVWKDDKTYVYTNAENISTSTGSKYVGANGDVFIGKSHNYIIGTCRKLGFHREAGGIILGLREAVSINDSIKTDFMFSALEIKETMLPKIEDTRNALLEYKDSVSAVNYVNNTDKDVYLTWLDKSDPRYGQEGTYVWKVGTRGHTQNMVLHYNESARLWRARLADNEQDKLEAFQDQAYFKENRSFDGGTSYSYSERRDTTKTSTFQQNAKVGAVYELKSQFSFNAAAHFGTNINFKTEVGYNGNHLTGDSLDNVKSYIEFDYDLNDGNPGTDFTVDIYRSPRGWGDIFLLRGGQSYNPYEGLEYAEYYQQEKNHIISYGTERMEQPVIAISTDGVVGAKSAILTDVPSGQQAQFTLHLKNDSQTNQPTPLSYNLLVIESTNTKGLQILMDGLPVNGRSILLAAGESTQKLITVKQTDQSVLDYDNVEIWFASQYQPNKIHDIVKLSVHFSPSSSSIDLAVDEPVLNIETLQRNEGNLLLKLSNFNRQFNNLRYVGLQYCYEGNTQWNTIHTYVTAKKDSVNESYSMLPDASTIRFFYNMDDDNLFPQGTYNFRAFTTTPYGNDENDAATVYSQEVTVIKDNVRPRNLTTPEPTNGILRYGDDIIVEFNEDIVSGYVSDKNIIVTAKLNDQPVDHDVAKLLKPYGDEQFTINPIFINGDFSVDFWMKWEDAGSILRLGSEQFALSVDAEGHIVASIGGAQVSSLDVVPKGVWTYMVLSYNSAEKSFTALAEYGTTTLQLFTDQKVDDGVVQQVHYTDDNHLYLGNMYGAMHDLALYNIYRDVDEAASLKNQAKDNYDYGLVNYWPFKEGHGLIASDTRHTHDFLVNDSWLIDNKNYSIRQDDENGLEADISRIKTGVGDSYAIELWVSPKYYEGVSQTIFKTGSKPSNNLELYYTQQRDWVLRYGEHEQVVVNHENFPYSSVWNHVALNVVRGQAASFYYNGQRSAVIAELDVPPLEGATMKLGEGCNVDELRIWHASLSESRLLNNMYNCIDTTDFYSRGLVAYYPFEKAGVVNGVSTMVPTLEDMAPKALSGLPATSITPLGKYRLVESTPPLKNAPIESRVIAKPVASERKLVIRLEEGSGIKARDIEGCTLNITVDKIFDMHGNQSNPIRWTTFVQLNTLKWLKDSVNIIKKYGEDYTFDVNIENRGGNTEYYDLCNVPSWLSLVGSYYTDDIAPLKTKTLRFKVNPLVPVGNYDVTIGLQGNNEILEPLRIVMTVRGEKPSWSVDPTKYENNMSIVGQIYVNGILMGNSESCLAAFIDDECRGIATPKQMRGAAYVALSVYGTAQQEVNGTMKDLDKDKPITFRIWDAATGVAYTNVIVRLPEGSEPEGYTAGDDITFDPTVGYGSFDHPVFFTKSNYVEQPLDLHPNWNWISLGVEPVNTKTSVVFKDITSWNVRLKDHGSGVAYCKGVYWAGSLTDVHSNTMYKMLLTRLNDSKDLPQPLSVIGQQVKLSETPITLKSGWNWIAYLPTVTMTIDQALAGVNARYGDQVKSQTGFSYYGAYGWEGNLEAMESGKGYLYKSLDNSTKTFVYPSALPSRSLRPMKSKRTMQIPSVFSPVEPTDYPDNMTMVILLTNDGQPVSDAEVAAFVNGECRGAATATVDDSGEEELQHPLYYLLIAGEGSGQAMELRAAINGNIRVLSVGDGQSPLTYSSDGNLGTPWEPFVVDLMSTQGIESMPVYSSSNGQWYDLSGRRISQPKKKGVYISVGGDASTRRNSVKRVIK